MDRDGTKSGFDLDLTKAVVETAGIPVIASGGCGALDHFSEVFEWTDCAEDCGAAVVNIISQLRRKMGPGNPIRTVPHSGYKFELPP